jgi:CrcB protein
MQQLLYIGIAGFCGSVSRFLVAGWASSLSLGRFPIGTMTVNVIGSLLLGFIYTLSIDRLAIHPDLKLAITVGFLGSFTTFSTFSLETFNLFKAGDIYLSLINILMNLFFSIAAVLVGITAAKLLYGVE